MHTNRSDLFFSDEASIRREAVEHGEILVPDAVVRRALALVLRPQHSPGVDPAATAAAAAGRERERHVDGVVPAHVAAEHDVPGAAQRGDGVLGLRVPLQGARLRLRRRRAGGGALQLGRGDVDGRRRRPQVDVGLHVASAGGRVGELLARGLLHGNLAQLHARKFSR